MSYFIPKSKKHGKKRRKKKKNVTGGSSDSLIVSPCIFVCLQFQWSEYGKGMGGGKKTDGDGQPLVISILVWLMIIISFLSTSLSPSPYSNPFDCNLLI